MRQKFLKSEKVELSYISEALQSIAIAHPEIAITLIYDGKTPVKTSGSGDLLCVLTEIYSNSIAGELKKLTNKMSYRICMQQVFVLHRTLPVHQKSLFMYL